MDSPEDRNDYKILLGAVLRQAMDDYVKLFHPRTRSKVYLQEAFDNAVGLFFNPDYRLENIWDQEGNNISLVGMIKEVSGLSSFDLKLLRQHLASQAKDYWGKRLVDSIEVPDTLVLPNGYVYRVVHAYRVEVDRDNLVIYCSREDTPKAKEEFFQVLLELLLENYDVSTELGKAFYRLLSMNNCFIKQ